VAAGIHTEFVVDNLVAGPQFHIGDPASAQVDTGCGIGDLPAFLIGHSLDYTQRFLKHRHPQKHKNKEVKGFHGELGLVFRS